MKSRIIKTIPESVILYRLEEHYDIISGISAKLGIKVITAGENQAGEAVGFLAGYNGFASNGSQESCDTSCMIFSAMTGKQLDSMLAELRKAGLSIPYKAVITASNQSWSLKKLAEELVKEHNQMNG